MTEQQQNDVKRVGIFGGTFDPPHMGHLAAAECARDMYRLDRVIFVPVGHPPHKAAERLTAARHRYLMTVLATLDNPCFGVSRVEIERRGTSYTVDTLRLLQAQHGKENEYFFLIGADALRALNSWKDPEQILQMCHLLALARPGYSLADLPQQLGALYTDHPDRFLVSEMPQIDVSAQRIRKQLSQGDSVRYWVPELVRNYIERFGLYHEASS